MVQVECSDTVPLWPFVYYSSKSDTTRLHLLFSLFTWYRSFEEGTITFFIILIRSTSKSSGEYILNILWPIIRYRSDGGDWSFAIRPFLWLISESSKFIFTIVGIIYYKRTGRDVYWHIAPFVFYRSSGNKTRFVVFPFIWVFGNGDTTKIYFLCIYIRFGAGRTTFFLFPFFYVSSGDGGWRMLVCGCIWVSVYDDRFKIMLPPFLFVIKTPSQYRLIIFPVIWYGSSDSCTTLWFAPYWYRNRGGNVTHCLIPAFFYTRFGPDSYFFWTVPYWVLKKAAGEYNYSIAFIIYYFKRVGSSTFVVFPVWWFFRYAESDWKLVFFPFWWQRKSLLNSHIVFFPFLWIFYSSGKSSVVFFPIVWRFKSGDSGSLLVFPIYYKNDQTLVVFPLYMRKKYSETRSFSMFLLYTRKIDGNNRTWCIFPLIWSFSRENHYRFTFFPCFYYLKTNDEHYVHLWPIFGRKIVPDCRSYFFAYPLCVFHNGNTFTQSWIFPLFYYNRNEGMTKFVSVIYYYCKTATTKKVVIPVLYYYSEAPNYQLRFIPLLYFSRRANGNLFKYAFIIYLKTISEADKTSFVYFFPVYGKETRGHSSVRHYLFYPIYSRRIDREAEVKVYDVLWPLFHYETTPETEVIRCLIYSHGKTPNWDYRLVIPVYFSFSYKEQRVEPLPIIVSSAPKLGSSDSKPSLGSPDPKPSLGSPDSLGTEMERMDSKASLQVTEVDADIMGPTEEGDAVAMGDMADLEMQQEREERRVNTVVTLAFSLFIPLLLFRRVTQNRGVIIAPLFYKTWSPKTGDFSTTFVPFYHHKKLGTSDTYSILLIVFRMFKDVERGVLKFNILLYFYTRIREFTSHLVVPLFYRSSGGGDSKLVISLIYWYSRHGESNPLTYHAFLWLHPKYFTLVCRHKSPDTTKFFFFPLIWRCRIHGTGKVTTCFLWLHPMVTLGKSRVQDGNKKIFLFPIFHYRSDGEEAAFSFIWFVLPFLALYRSIKRGDRTILRWFWPLIYRSSDSEGTSLTCFLWLHPVVALSKSIQSPGSSKIFFFPIFWRYRGEGTAITSFVYLFHPIVSLIHRESNAGSPTITWMFPIFRTQYGNGVSITSIVWLFHPSVSFIYRNKSEGQSLTWMFPLFRTKSENGSSEFSLVWFFHPRACFYYRMKSGQVDLSLSYMLFLYWHKVTSTSNGWGFVWLFHFRATLIYYHTSASSNQTKVYFWPIFYVNKKPNATKWCVVYFYPPSVAFIRGKSTGSGDSTFTIFLIYCTRMLGSQKVTSIIYLFHPAASLIRITRGPTYFSIWMAVVFYYDNDTQSHENQFAILWFVKPSIAFITRTGYGNGDMVGHIFLVFWKSIDDGYLSFGFFWLFFYKASLIAYRQTADYTKHYFIPVYWYTSTSEAWSFSFFLWFIFMKGTSHSRDFRVLYRFFRVATGDKTIVELQPFFFYKSTSEKTEFMLLGGFCGNKRTSRNRKCRMLWVCVC